MTSTKQGRQLLGDFWSILVLDKNNTTLDRKHLQTVLHFQSCFVSLFCTDSPTFPTLFFHEICGNMFAFHETVCGGGTILYIYKIGVWRYEEGERNLLVAPLPCEKDGHRDTWRYSCRRSQWVVRFGYCRFIFYNRTVNFFVLVTDIVNRLKYVTDWKVTFFKRNWFFFQEFPLSPVKHRCPLHSLQRWWLAECVFDGLGDRVLKSSSHRSVISVYCHINYT